MQTKMKQSNTPLLESKPNFSAHHQRHIWKVEPQVSTLKSYFDCELSSLNNKRDTILNFITELRERPSIETSNINFLQSEQTSENETKKSLIQTQAKALETVANLKHRSSMETEKSSQQNKLTNQPTASFQNQKHQPEECQHQQQHQQQSHRSNYKHKRESEKYQNRQQQSILQEQQLQQYQKQESKKTLYIGNLSKDVTEKDLYSLLG